MFPRTMFFPHLFTEGLGDLGLVCSWLDMIDMVDMVDIFGIHACLVILCGGYCCYRDRFFTFMDWRRLDKF